MKVAAIQMVSGGDVSANLRQARILLEQAAHAGAELAVLPEYFCLIGAHDADKLALARAMGQHQVLDGFITSVCRVRRRSGILTPTAIMIVS